jgi:hypothetical protein
MAHRTNLWEEPTREIMSKRRRGFPSETQVKKGFRQVHGDKELREKLGRNDLCPCGSQCRFQELLHAFRPIRLHPAQLLFSANDWRHRWEAISFSRGELCFHSRCSFRA